MSQTPEDAVPASASSASPSARKWHANDLFTYLPAYAVVVCQECRYAVQPQALSSHLQRHRVYQKDRQVILHQLSRLHLADPQKVRLPSPDTETLPQLELHDGFKCEASGCGYACASLKRMCQHWSSAHDVADSSLVKSRQAWLQTFFRGSQIRYFEVQNSRPMDDVDKSRLMGRSRPLSKVEKRKRSSTSPPSSSASVDQHHQQQNPQAAAAAGAGTIDIQALMYLHCFTVDIAPQFCRGGADSPELWSRRIPELAAKLPFLMYGILAASAFHRVRQNIGVDERALKIHHEAGMRYQALGLSGYREAISDPNQTNAAAILAFGRLVGIQQCIQSLLETKAGAVKITTAAIVEFLVFLRGSCGMTIRMQHFLPPDSELMLPPEARTSFQHIELGEDLSTPRRSAVPEPVWAQLVILYHELPPHDSPSPHSPSQSSSLPVTSEIAKAFSSLVSAVCESYDTSQDPMTAAWNGVEGWAKTLEANSRFLDSLQAGHNVGLLVFAHFCILLLSRIETFVPDVAGMTEALVNMALALLKDERCKEIITHAARGFIPPSR